MLPTQKEIIEHVREHFGISGKQVVQIMKTPMYPTELRDEFAAKAMQAHLAQINTFPDEHWRDGVALDAYMMADAMLKVRASQ